MPRVSQPLSFVSSTRTRWPSSSQHQAQSGIQFAGPVDSKKEFFRWEPSYARAKLFKSSSRTLEDSRAQEVEESTELLAVTKTFLQHICIPVSARARQTWPKVNVLKLYIYYYIKKFYFQFKNRYRIEAQFSIAFPLK